ncbi:MAG: type II secretion system protein [Hydrogenophaga sp.]
MQSGNRGFAYVFLLVLIAILAGAATTTLDHGSAMSRRSAEKELLIIGQSFESALQSYARIQAVSASPTGMPVKSGPKNLEDLLRDPRTPVLHRHLRKIHSDPLTGFATWGVVLDRDGNIIGVYSLAKGTPIKRNGFEPNRSHFNEAERYQDWVFGLPQAKASLTTRKNQAGP